MIHFYTLYQIHRHHKARYKKEYKRIQLWFLLTSLLDLSGMGFWSLGFVFRLGAHYIRVGETYTAFKCIAVSISFRLVQDFTFLREPEVIGTTPPMLCDVGQPTLNKTVLCVPAEKGSQWSDTHLTS
jgi:hypothetical protein